MDGAGGLRSNAKSRQAGGVMSSLSFSSSAVVVFLSTVFVAACSADDGRSEAGPGTSGSGTGAQAGTGANPGTGGADTGGGVGVGGVPGAGSATGGETGTGGDVGVGGSVGAGGDVNGSGGGGNASPGHCRSFSNGSGSTQPCYVGNDGKAYCIADDGSTTQLSALPGTAVNVTGQNFTTAACAVNDAGAVHCEQYAVLGTTAAFAASGAVQVSGAQTGWCALVGSAVSCKGVGEDAPMLPQGELPTEIACFYNGCCALSDAGKAYCWGNTAAIGGTGSGVTEVPTPSGKKVVALGPGQDNMCLVLEGGQVQCWGEDWNKQIGGGGTNKTTGATLVASGAVAVAAGQFHTCVAFEDGHVECISGGQTEGAGLDQGVLTTVSGVSGAVALSAGKHYTCALVGGGAIQCWGRIGSGSTPVTVSGPPAGSCD